MLQRQLSIVYGLTMVALLVVLLLYYYGKGSQGLSLRGFTGDGDESRPVKPLYAVLIDAGSSGSRVHVYQYVTGASSNSYPAVQLPDEQFKMTPGLSDYATALEGAAASVQALVDFALDKVPEASRSATPIHLLATAGLRLLPKQQSEEVLNTVREVLGKSGFLFSPEWARILPGELEGLYAWAAFNYASGALQRLAWGAATTGSAPAAYTPPAGDTWGVLELGGASLQVTFMPEHGALLPEQAKFLDLPGLGKSVPLYTHSFLGYGANVAFVRAASIVQLREDKKDPCLPQGFVTESGIVGSGNFGECRQLAATLLPAKPCKYERCSIGGQYLPRLAGVFLGTENFYYTAQRLGMRVGIATANISAAGKGSPESMPQTPSAHHGRSVLHQGVGHSHVVSRGIGTAGAGQSASLHRRGIKSVEQDTHTTAPKAAGSGPAGTSSVPQQPGGMASLKQLEAAGTAFCSLPWERLKQDFIEAQHVPQEYVMRVCFSAAYAWAILHNAFHIQDTEQRVVFTNSVQVPPRGQPEEVNWVLGALLLEVIKSVVQQETDTQPDLSTGDRMPSPGAREGWTPTWQAILLGGAGLVVVAAAVAYAMMSSVSSADAGSDVEAQIVELKHRPASAHGTAAEQVALLQAVQAPGLTSSGGLRVGIS